MSLIFHIQIYEVNVKLCECVLGIEDTRETPEPLVHLEPLIFAKLLVSKVLHP